MILVDFNQVVISNLCAQLGPHITQKVDEGILRHMVLNSLRSYKQKFQEDYGDLVIACDNKNYWRKKIFPYYKASRKKAQEKSGIDWPGIFQSLDKIRAELKQNFPYRVIEVETAEADDIIGTLCMEFAEAILIMSADKDFIQLQTWDNVKQYDPIRKKWIKDGDPSLYREIHIIRGDTGDGIPNILSPDNCLVVGDRQRPMTKKRLAEYLKQYPLMADCDDVVQRNYNRNRQLIDLRKIPKDLQAKIREEYILQADKKRDGLMNYFMKHRLKNLLECISDF